MKNLVLVKKYAQGLVQAVKDEAELEAIRADLKSFLDVYADHGELRNALLSPFINSRTKARILEDVLAGIRAGGKTARFLSLLFEHKRLGLLGDIVTVLPEMWNEKLGIMTFVVASVIPLTAVQKRRLRETLETAEGGPVSLVFEMDPEIVGGLSLRRGHIVYDVSIQGNLNHLRELIQQG